MRSRAFLPLMVRAGASIFFYSCLFAERRARKHLLMMKKSLLKTSGVRGPTAVIVAAAVVALAYVVQSRIKLDSDVIAGLPAQDPAIADTVYVLSHHHVLDSV